MKRIAKVIIVFFVVGAQMAWSEEPRVPDEPQPETVDALLWALGRGSLGPFPPAPKPSED